MILRKTGFTELSNDDLMAVAPSVFAGGAMAGVSDRYAFLPTINVVDGMRKNGWLPVKAVEQRVRLDERRGSQKHMIRFQRAEQIGNMALGLRTEVVLLNSHDRSSAYQLHAGLFRLVCANGLTVSDSTFSHISIRHSGFKPENVIEGSFKLLEDVPQIEGKVAAFQGQELDETGRRALAESALLLKYDDLATAPISADNVLIVRRSDDRKNDLWTTYNVIQENLMQGGLRDNRRHREDGSRFKRTGQVKSIDENVRLNKALWHLTETMAKTLA